MGIHATYPGRIRPLGHRIEMDDLSGRMHAGVGPPGTDDGYWAISNLCERRFQRILHGGQDYACRPISDSVRCRAL